MDDYNPTTVSPLVLCAITQQCVLTGGLWLDWGEVCWLKKAYSESCCSKVIALMAAWREEGRGAGIGFIDGP